MARTRNPPIPITVVAGPRGAGKTTLINRLLEDPRFANTAVVLNDFGATAVRNAMVETAEDGFIALGSGCVCCSVRGALTDGLEKLLRDLDNNRLAYLARVIIEADEAADPAAIVGAILAHPYLSLRFVGDGTIVVLDVLTAAGNLSERAATVRQVAGADAILLSRADRADDALRAELGALNPAVQILDAATVEPGALTDHGAFDPAVDDADAWLLSALLPVAVPNLAGEAGRVHVFAVKRERSLPFRALDLFLEYLVALQGANLIRVRGIVQTAAGEAVIVDGGGAYFHPPLIVDRQGPPEIRFAVTAFDMDRARFESYLDAFINEARIDTPDRTAITDNPLAIPGFSARSGLRS